MISLVITDCCFDFSTLHSDNVTAKSIDVDDTAYQNTIQADDQQLTGQTTTLQQTLDTSTTTADAANTSRDTADQQTLQNAINNAEQTVQQLDQAAQQQLAQTNADAQTAATQTQSQADAAAQTAGTQNQTAFDQAAAAAEANYANGTDDQAATTVPDFSQDPAVLTATQNAQTADNAANQQDEATLTQQMNDVQASLQNAYTTADGNYNNTVAADAATEQTAQNQADQNYNNALADHQATHDGAVAAAQDAYDQTVGAADQAYTDATGQSAQDQQNAQDGADAAYAGAADAAQATYEQAAQQANDAYNAAQNQAESDYNTAISTAQNSYNDQANQLDNTFNQNQTNAQNTYNAAIQTAADTRDTALTNAQNAYNAADQAAQARASTGRQAATTQFLTTTAPVDKTYNNARQSAQKDYQSALNADQAAYNDAVNSAATDFWNYINGSYATQWNNIESQSSNADPATTQAAWQALATQKAGAQRIYLVAQDNAAITQTSADGAARIAHQGVVNGIEKTKYDAYAAARETYNNAVNDANAGYTTDLAQPLADQQIANATALQAYLDTVADAGQVLTDTQADNEQTYDTGVTAAKQTLADTLAGADQTLADTLDAAVQTRDDAISVAQQQQDDALASAEQSWQDSYATAADGAEQSDTAAYTTYLSAVTAAGVTLDDAVTAAGVAQDEADAASGVDWTDASDTAWEQQQLADAAAAIQWDTDTTSADSTALDAARQDSEACDNAEMAAWQTQVDTVLSAVGADVDSWAAQSGTNYAHLLDVEMAAWIGGTEADATAEVTDTEADYNAQTDLAVTQAQADDVESNAEDANAVPAVQSEADAASADAHDEAQAAVADVTASDTAWQTDEHAATLDAVTHDTNESAAAVANANSDQQAADAWEQAEAPAASADQKAVDAAEQQQTQAQDAANKTGNDQLAQAVNKQAVNDASAAQSRDTQVAAVHHGNVIAEAQLADAAIRAAASAALKGVQADVGPAPAAIIATVNAQVADARLKNADATAKNIDVADVQRTALVAQVQKQVDANNLNAQNTLNTDSQRALTDPVVMQVNPPVPTSVIQKIADWLPTPGWKMAATIAVGAAALLIPGVGPVVAVIGLGLLVGSVAYSATDRYFNQNQSGLQSLVGSVYDATGVTSLYAGISGRDLATGYHLGLTESQQRQMLAQGSFQVGSLLLPLAAKGLNGVKGFVRGRMPAAPKAPLEPPATVGGKPAVPQPPTAPAKSSYGSNAGKAGAGEAAQTATPCFPGGTLICAASGLKLIEAIREDDLVWSRPEAEPEADVVLKRVKEVFVRMSPILRVSVGGRVIGVTANHPFWVEGRGWLEAGLLQAGDLLRSSDNRMMAVSSVADSGEVATVYNFHVADYHTYFVGGDNWDFDVWTHNSASHGGGSSGSQGGMGNAELGNLIRRVAGNQQLGPSATAKLLAQEAAKIAGVTFEPVPGIPGTAGVFRGATSAGGKTPILAILKDGRAFTGIAEESLVADPAGGSGLRIVITRMREIQ